MKKRVVVKLGTSVLTNGTPHIDQPQLVSLVQQCAELRQAGHEVIICTSGAIAAGRAELNFPDIPTTISNKQMFAAVGQTRLMQLWSGFFAIYGIHVGQILLTRDDVESRQRYLNARDNFRALLEQNNVPIVNENDAVAIEEIKVGDNDNLSALVAVLAEADLLLLLTDQVGLYTADPRTNKNAELITDVHEITPELKQLAGGSVSGLGVGGMATKLISAEIATRAGIDVIIASGSAPNIITRLAAGEAHGTRLHDQSQPIDGRHRWLLAGSKPSGQLIVDEGAANALQNGSPSLLPAGIREVIGDFKRGDPIRIVSPSKVDLARGLSRYSAESLRKIKGHQSTEIEQILGYTYGKVAVHRNDLILLKG